MKIVLVHGFNIRDGGKRTVDQLAPFIKEAGYSVDLDEGDYGFFNIWMVRFRRSKTRQRVLHRLAKAFEKADVIITHSNGANFTNQALDLMESEFNNTKLVIHISPALNRNTELPTAIHHQLVLYTPHDRLVKLSSLLLFHPWGMMGAKGYSGNDNRNVNVKVESVRGHSDWFKTKHVARTWKKCLTFIQEYR